MNKLWTFASTWITSTFLLLWLGDYNMYLVDQNGNITIKEHATFTQRFVFSILFAAIFSVVNTGMLWGWHKFRGKGRHHHSRMNSPLFRQES
jgi:hypothetical protein